MPDFSMYQTKTKRAVDPNAPPRPNLLSHEKVLKDTKITMENQAQAMAKLNQRLEELERKVMNQAAYLSALHAQLQGRS